jgi:hypothetical protein
VSTSIPRVSPTLQQEYRDALIQPNGNSTSQVQQFEEIEKEVSDKTVEEYRRLHGLSEPEMYEEVNKGRSHPRDDMALRRAVIHRLSTHEMNIQTEHFLKPFAFFMEPNPRAMKRLSNAYTLARDIHIMQKSKIYYASGNNLLFRPSSSLDGFRLQDTSLKIKRKLKT